MAAMSRKAVVLIVDDEPDVCRVMSVIVAGMGHRSISATTRDEALEIVQTELPDVVVLDWRMTGLGVLEFKKLVEKNEPAPTIIFCTAGSDVAEQALQFGFDYTLPKPFDPSLLEMTINACLG